MATELYILGTSHPLQCGSAECTQTNILAFDTELRRLCETFKILRIAEEMTADGLTHHKVTGTIGQRVAKDIGIPHQSVDLSPEERIGVSIDDSVVIATVRRYGIFDGGPFREAFDDLADGIRERVWVANYGRALGLITVLVPPFGLTFLGIIGIGNYQEIRDARRRAKLLPRLLDKPKFG